MGEVAVGQGRKKEKGEGQEKSSRPLDNEGKNLPVTHNWSLAGGPVLTHPLSTCNY